MGKHKEARMAGETLIEQEIEDKYWIDTSQIDFDQLPYVDLLTAYLRLEKRKTIRARRIYNPGDKQVLFEFTEKVKSKKDSHKRKEETEFITQGQFEEYVSVSPYYIIPKRRFFLPYQDTLTPGSNKDYTVAIDCFDFGTQYYPLIIAELEFRTLDELYGFSPPSWLRRMTEMEQRQASNSSFARFGPPFDLLSG